MSRTNEARAKRRVSNQFAGRSCRCSWRWCSKVARQEDGGGIGCQAGALALPSAPGAPPPPVPESVVGTAHENVESPVVPKRIGSGSLASPGLEGFHGLA